MLGLSILGLFRLGQMDLENTILEFGVDLNHIGVFRQGETQLSLGLENVFCRKGAGPVEC